MNAATAEVVLTVEREFGWETSFLPNPGNALAADRQIQRQLDTSIEAITAALAMAMGQTIVCPESSAIPGPLTYAAYSHLLEAVLDDDVGTSLNRLKRYFSVASVPASGFVALWSDFGADDRSLISRFLNSDPSTRVELRSPSDGAVSAATRAVLDAMSLLGTAAPEIADEIGALIRQVVLVAGSVNENVEFDGGSCFDLWGALFLNAERHMTRVDAVNGLSHESAHAVLFGQGEGRPFVDNPDDERYASPLRHDPRPLDGIFHAAFVSARMAYAHQRLLTSGLLGCDEAAIATRCLEDSRAAFEDGRATLMRHATMTEKGKVLLDGATRFMHAA